MFMRMGQYQQAHTVFKALEALYPNDAWVQRNLAAIALARSDATSALEHLRRAVGDGNLPSRDAVLYLLRAQALWHLGRESEARNAVDTYLAMNAQNGNKA